MQTTTEKHANQNSQQTKTVAINPVSLLEANRVVGEVFLPDWEEKSQWSIHLESGKPWLFQCDFHHQQIGVAKAHFANRDELRSIILLLLSIARLGYAGFHRLDETLRTIEMMAGYINRKELAFRIADARYTLATLAADLCCTESGVTIYDWPMVPVETNMPASDYDVMFDDSLRDGDIKRILSTEKKFIRKSH